MAPTRISPTGKHTTLIILAIALLASGGGFFYYQNLKSEKKEMRYVLGSVSKDTVTTSVSGSGEVSITDQIDLKPKVSGDIVSVHGKKGDTVKKGTVLVSLDARDARKAMRDAQASLQSAQLSLAKMKQPPDQLSIVQAQNALAQSQRTLSDLQKPPDALALLQAQNAVTQARDTKQKASDDLKKTYDDGYNAVANAYLDLPSIMNSLNTIFFDSTFEGGQWNIDWYLNKVNRWDTDEKAKAYHDELAILYNTARDRYTGSFTVYKNTSRSADVGTLEALISDTYATIQSVADTAKAGSNYITYVQGIMDDHNVSYPSTVSTHQTNLNSYIGKTNTHLSVLLSDKQGIVDDKKAIVSADRSIAEKIDALNKLNEPVDQTTIKKAEETITERLQSLQKLKSGPDTIDIQTQELSIQQRKNALQDAQEQFDNYSVRAPFAGVLAGFDAKVGDSASQSASLGTLITTQSVAQISLNEVDAVKVHNEQRATLTFDAIPDLSITGSVVDIDAIGTVSQGVVSYNVKISFDTQDDRVRPGMTVSASIILNTHLDVLTIPNSAVKTQGANSFVEVVNTSGLSQEAITDAFGVVLTEQPKRQQVQIGLSNDDVTEIISGLKEGDVVVVSTFSATKQSGSANPSSTQPAIRIPGLPGGSGGGGSTFRGGGGRGN